MSSMLAPERWSTVARGVFRPATPTALISGAEVAALGHDANVNGLGRSRILLHGSPDATLQQMLIFHRRGTPILPHINDRGPKAYHIVSGRMAVIFFDDSGGISQAVELAEPSSDGRFLLRWEEPQYHTILTATETVCFVETVSGPHSTTRYAAWTPNDEAAVYAWWRDLHRKIGLEFRLCAGT